MTKRLDERNLEKMRVSAIHKGMIHVLGDKGELPARLRPSAYLKDRATELMPTVGDFVLCSMDEQSKEAIIERTLPRNSFFGREDPDTGRGMQAVAANFDYVFVVSSLNQEFSARRLERYLSVALSSGGQPVVVLTKLDIAKGAKETLERAKAVAGNTPVHAVSAYTGEGMEPVREYLTDGKVCVLLGSSGVGKSSLANALLGGQVMRVNDIREDDAKGRHTTTHRQLLKLPGGAYLIDTPGMRSLALWDTAEGLEDAFADIIEIAKGCRFRDCSHEKEPGCALLEAVKAGSLERKRLENYRALRKETERAREKADKMRRKKEAGRSQRREGKSRE